MKNKSIASLIRVTLVVVAAAAICMAQSTNHSSASSSNSTPGQHPSRASLLVRQITHEIEALKPQFTELSGFSVSNHLSQAKIDYRHNVDYVPELPKHKSHYSVRQGGCLISIQAWESNMSGWPGMEGGVDTLSIDRTLPNGIRIMANIRAPNEKLRKAVADTITTRIQAAKMN